MNTLGSKNIAVVRSSWLEEGGRRLDCNPYMSGALEARDALKRLRTPKHKLSDVTDRIFHAGREGRMWVDDEQYGVPFLGSSDIRAADFSTLPLMAKKQIGRNPLFTLAEGWTLITRSGTIGRMAYARSDMAGMACSEHVLRVVPSIERIPAGYLYAFLSSRYGVPLVVSGTYGAIIQHIEPEHIADLPVPRFNDGIETEVAKLIEAAGDARANASAKRREAIAVFQKMIGWSGFKHCEPVTQCMSSMLARRMDAFHYSVKVDTGRRALAACSSVTLSDKVERVYEPNRGPRLKVTDPEYGIPFLSSSTVFEVNPTAEYLISRAMTPNVENLLLSSCDVLLPRSGQVGGIIGRAVLPFPSSVGSAGSEHLVRVRCRTVKDAGYFWAVRFRAWLLGIGRNCLRYIDPQPRF